VVLVTLSSAVTYYNMVYRWQAYSRLVDAFLTAGIRADTAALRRSAVDSTPVTQILTTPAGTLEELRQSMRIRWGRRHADTVVLDYATRVAGCYRARLIREEGGWRVSWAAREPC
jgi:hypothetical protein